MGYIRLLDVQIMEKTCNLSTVKNTPSEARRDIAPKAEFYYIETIEDIDINDGMQFESIQFMVDVIFEVLEYSDLRTLDDAIVFGYYSDGTKKPLFMFKNDVVEHNFTITNISMVRKKMIAYEAL